MNEVFRKVSSGRHTEFNVYGRAINGEARSIDEDLTLIGHDVALTLPSYDVAAVFDGAGGAIDVGLPDRAALVAARATRSYYQQGGDSLHGAIDEARRAVESDQESGVCVGSLVVVRDELLDVLTVGDTGVLVYDSAEESIPFFMDQQVESGNPVNYLGRRGDYMPKAGPGVFKQATYNQGDELYVMSDGALGNWARGSEVQGYHIQSAHQIYQTIQLIEERYPHFEDRVRQELAGSKARSLRERQLNESTNAYGEGGVCSPELVDPSLFKLSKVDWDVWLEIVEPMVSQLRVQVSLGNRTMLKSLVDRPIAWQHERPRLDDATIIHTNLNH